MIQIRFSHLLLLIVTFIAIFVGGRIVSGQGQSADPAAAVVTGTTFTYQGYLEDDAGPIDGQSCDFQFSLYDTDDGATPLAGPLTRTTDLLAGVFTVALDFGDAFKGNARFLGIMARCPAGAGDYTALTPHQSLTAVPYAMSLRPGATIEGDVAAGRGVLNLNSSQDGLSIGTAGDDGLAINKAGDTAILCTINSESNGVEICSAENSGFSVGWAGDHGLSVGSAGQDGLFVNSAAQEGVQVNEAGDIGLYVGSAGTDGLHIDSVGNDGLVVREAAADGLQIDTAHDTGVEIDWTGGPGVWVQRAAGNGITAATINPGRFAGHFLNKGNPPVAGVGLFAAGNQGTAADIVLGANSNDNSLEGDDGVISSDPAFAGSDIILRSNDNVIAILNDDGNADDGDFEVHNKYGDILFDVDDSGKTFSRDHVYADYGTDQWLPIGPIGFGHLMFEKEESEVWVCRTVSGSPNVTTEESVYFGCRISFASVVDHERIVLVATAQTDMETPASQPMHVVFNVHPDYIDIILVGQGEPPNHIYFVAYETQPIIR